MQKSEQIDKLATALAEVQKNITPAKKDKDNPFFKSKYADLTGVWEVIEDLLPQHGLSVVQVGEPSPEKGIASLTTVLMHSSGQWIAGTMDAPLAKLDPQALGSATTYLRRYGLAAIIGIRTEDDDGASASGTTVVKR